MNVSIKDNFSFLVRRLMRASSRSAQLLQGPDHDAANLTGRRDLVYLAPFADSLCSLRRRATQVVMPV